MTNPCEGPPVCGFRLWEKIYAQSSFIAMGVLGTVGILLADRVWAIPYAVIVWYGIPGVVMRHLVCPRCPHLFEAGDCLQLPTALTRRLAGPRNPDPLSRWERFQFYAIFVLIPVYPVYWLWSDLWLLIPFLLTALMWYAGQFLYFCRKCRVHDCPFNRAGVDRRVSGHGNGP